MSDSDRPALAAPLTLGTAGHIDHGKTTLITALTGTDTDRLAEERRRGMSIALGYAELALPSGRRLSVVDVPGHERFVRTMVAGATGIDLFLMAIAADDGVMPQTREHATILRALGVRAGVVAITKSDRADPAPAARAAAELLPAAPVISVSPPTGAGLDELLASLDHVATTVVSRAGAPGAARLHVDRVFSVHGTGTVVTGTLWSGSLAVGDRVVIAPGGHDARVRHVEVHGVRRRRVDAGQRVALALAGVRRGQIGRGDVVCEHGAGIVARHALDVAIASPAHPRDGERLMAHHGTREAAARAVRTGDVSWRLRLESPLLACAGDHVVLRRIAPPGTLGGAVVLERAAFPRADDAAAVPPAPPGPPPGRGAELELERRLSDAGLAPLAEIERRLIAYLRANGAIDLPGLRDELGTSRRLALELLRHFDDRRLTRRRPDDQRVLRVR